jgi:hypothetical protein
MYYEILPLNNNHATPNSLKSQTISADVAANELEV